MTKIWCIKVEDDTHQPDEMSSQMRVMKTHLRARYGLSDLLRAQKNDRMTSNLKRWNGNGAPDKGDLEEDSYRIQAATNLLKQSLRSLPDTVPESGIRTKSGLIVLPEGWHLHTLPVNREIFSNDCRVTIATIRNGLPLTVISSFVAISRSSFLFQRILFFCIFLFSVVAKCRDVSLFFNDFIKFITSRQTDHSRFVKLFD